MNDREVLELLLQKISFLEHNLVTKHDLASLKDELKDYIEKIVTEQQKDIVALLQLTNDKLDKQAEILKILSSRSIEHEAEISVLKHVK